MKKRARSWTFPNYRDALLEHDTFLSIKPPAPGNGHLVIVITEKAAEEMKTWPYGVYSEKFGDKGLFLRKARMGELGYPPIKNEDGEYFIGVEIPAELARPIDKQRVPPTRTRVGLSA
jgi:hypothetical protein